MGDLSPWGYVAHSADEDYSNLDEGGYWGIGPRLKAVGYSDRCVQYGGKWIPANFQRFDEMVKRDFRILKKG
jgi:hypothetical protein